MKKPLGLTLELGSGGNDSAATSNAAAKPSMGVKLGLSLDLKPGTNSANPSMGAKLGLSLELGTGDDNFDRDEELMEVGGCGCWVGSAKRALSPSS